MTTEISVVLPAYENLGLFSRALLSVLVQQSVHHEVIVTDDSRSTEIHDFVRSLAGQYPSLVYLGGPKSGNPVDNWNHGIARATARYCVLVHHDEFFVDPRFLRRAVDFLEASNTPGVVADCAIVSMGRVSRFLLTRRVFRWARLPLWMLYLMNYVGATACVVFRRSSDTFFDPSFIYIVDVDFYYRLFVASRRIAYLPGLAVVSIAHHSEQISTKHDVRNLHIEELRRLAVRPSSPLSGLRARLLLAGAAAQKWRHGFKK